MKARSQIEQAVRGAIENLHLNQGFPIAIEEDISSGINQPVITAYLLQKGSKIFFHRWKINVKFDGGKSIISDLINNGKAYALDAARKIKG